MKSLRFALVLIIFTLSVSAQQNPLGVDAKDLLNDPTVSRIIEDAWDESGIGTENSHEEGGWITRNVDNDGNTTYAVVRWPSGPSCSEGGSGCYINPDPKDQPPGTVGHFHTHPLPEIDSNGDGITPVAGPSKKDIEHAERNGIVGIIRNENGTDSYNGYGCVDISVCNDDSGDRPPPEEKEADPANIVGSYKGPISVSGTDFQETWYARIFLSGTAYKAQVSDDENFNVDTLNCKLSAMILTCTNPNPNPIGLTGNISGFVDGSRWSGQVTVEFVPGSSVKANFDFKKQNASN